MRNKTVTILMATYNGATHIENQILSLQQQKLKDWVLFIHDDGSSDDTVAIIKNLQLTDKRINLIEDGITGLGAGKNFLSTVKHSQSTYTIFCDQDDIWLENKLSDMVAHAERVNLADEIQPSIVYADGYAFNDSTGEIDFSGISHNHANDLSGFLFFNGGYQGCSIMFNQAMVKFLSNYKGEIYLHDDLASLAAHALGKVHFLPKKLMLYRQHSSAVTGIKSFQSGALSYLKSDIKYLLSKKHSTVKESFYNNHYQDFTSENNKIFSNYIKFIKAQSKFKQLYYLNLGRFSLNQSRCKLLLKFFLRRKFDS